jgi:hypothetical protein
MDGNAPPTVSHYDAMVANRQQFLASWLAWVSTKPGDQVARDEARAAVLAIHQIVSIYVTPDFES